jgi:hypothetical protein
MQYVFYAAMQQLLRYAHARFDFASLREEASRNANSLCG